MGQYKQAMFRGFVHRFLRWSPPALGAGYAAVLGIAATAAPANNDADRFLDGQIALLRAIVTSELFPWVAALCVLVWLAAFLWTGQERKPKPKSGIWLYGEGLEHVKVSRAAPGSFETKFFPLPPHNDSVDQVISAKNQSNEAAIKRRLSVDAWMPFDDVIRYVANESSWTSRHDPKDPNFSIWVADALQSALLNGDLRSRGRYFHDLKGGVRTPPLHPSKDSPPTFWDGKPINAWWALNHRSQRMGGALVESGMPPRSGEHEGMHDIRLDRSQAEALWPPKNEDRAAAEISDKNRHSTIIAKGRDIVTRFRSENPSEAFEIFARRQRDYLDIQPHLGDAYQAWVVRNADRNVSSIADGEFLRELARLEREWGLI